MGSPFSHCAVPGAECLGSLCPRPLDGNLKSLAESRMPRLMPRASDTVPAKHPYFSPLAALLCPAVNAPSTPLRESLM